MKTTTTYKAELEIPVPGDLTVYLRTEPISELGESTEGKKILLVVMAQSPDSMLEARTKIGEFVSATVAAEELEDEVVS